MCFCDPSRRISLLGQAPRPLIAEASFLFNHWFGCHYRELRAKSRLMTPPSLNHAIAFVPLSTLIGLGTKVAKARELLDLR